MKRRLALCFDGTWNTVKDHTNVSRIHAATKATADSDGPSDVQLKYYDEGVGTDWYDRIRGGVLGFGLSKNIKQGYQWLIRHYRPETEIFLFGFSRGAYTARSLAGLIDRCGIPPHPGEGLEAISEQAFRIYRASPKPDAASQGFIQNRSRVVRIRFIGVWDTVGALGVPLVNLNIAERFHDTSLSVSVDNAFHALAIDEHRKDYAAALWTANPGHARIEQRWFPGAHANVGGGYQDDLLPDPPLKWIADRARDCGLVIEEEATRLDGGEYRAPVRDSYAEFMFGIYRILKFGRRNYRPIGEHMAEAVDKTAYKKWAADPSYRPRNLAHAAPGVAMDRDAATTEPS
jgi:uncharacterized protein (DUF2235 family)